MDNPILQDQIAAAKAYEDLHVAAFFQPWAGHVLDAIQIEPGHRVLDVAYGTGVLAHEAAVRVGSTGFVAGIDPGLLFITGIYWRLYQIEGGGDRGAC